MRFRAIYQIGLIITILLSVSQYATAQGEDQSENPRERAIRIAEESLSECLQKVHEHKPTWEIQVHAKGEYNEDAELTGDWQVTFYHWDGCQWKGFIGETTLIGVVQMVDWEVLYKNCKIRFQSTEPTPPGPPLPDLKEYFPGLK